MILTKSNNSPHLYFSHIQVFGVGKKASEKFIEKILRLRAFFWVLFVVFSQMLSLKEQIKINENFLKIPSTLKKYYKFFYFNRLAFFYPNEFFLICFQNVKERK